MRVDKGKRLEKTMYIQETQQSRGAGGQSMTNNNDYRKHLLSTYYVLGTVMFYLVICSVIGPVL